MCIQNTSADVHEFELACVIIVIHSSSSNCTSGTSSGSDVAYRVTASAIAVRLVVCQLSPGFIVPLETSLCLLQFLCVFIACLFILFDAWRSLVLRANSYNGRFGRRVLALGPTSARSIA